jgi:argininosuccinate lyase
MRELLNGLEFDPPLPGPETASLDLAEALVRKGVPFREAHSRVGQLVALLEDDGRTLSDASVEDLLEIDGRFEETDLDLLDPNNSIRARSTYGSGSPHSVRTQIAEIRKHI